MGKDRKAVNTDRITHARVGGIIFIMIIAIAAMCSSCTRTVYVPLKETQTVWQHQTDTVHQTDSIIREKETVVMQLDSQAMADYGIRLQTAERAWLVKERELADRISKLIENHADTVIVTDTIQVPVPVEKKQSVGERIENVAVGFIVCVCLVILGFALFRISKNNL